MAEEKIKPYTISIDECPLDEKSVKESTAVLLSNDRATCWVEETRLIMTTELISLLQNSTFALQMNESRDVARIAALLVF